jgi:copper chaperone
MSTTTTFRIEGMTCAHCAAAVTKELAAVPGVESVSVSLADATATVVGAAEVDDAAVAAAVDEAGYAVAGRC